MPCRDLLIAAANKEVVPTGCCAAHELDHSYTAAEHLSRVCECPLCRRTPTFKWLEKAAVPVQKEIAQGDDAATEDKWLVRWPRL